MNRRDLARRVGAGAALVAMGRRVLAAEAFQQVPPASALSLLMADVHLVTRTLAPVTTDAEVAVQGE